MSRVYDRHSGAAIQYGYSNQEHLKDIFLHLLQTYPRIFVKNLDADCEEVYKMLTSISFTEVTQQYEMILQITNNTI